MCIDPFLQPPLTLVRVGCVEPLPATMSRYFYCLKHVCCCSQPIISGILKLGYARESLGVREQLSRSGTLKILEKIVKEGLHGGFKSCFAKLARNVARKYFLSKKGFQVKKGRRKLFLGIRHTSRLYERVLN